MVQDGLIAIRGGLNTPMGLFHDANSMEIFIADFRNNRVRLLTTEIHQVISRKKELAGQWSRFIRPGH